MKKLDWFNRNPKAPNAWLYKAQLKPGELVEVGGYVYRHAHENGEHTLTPAPKERSK